MDLNLKSNISPNSEIEQYKKDKSEIKDIEEKISQKNSDISPKIGKTPGLRRMTIAPLKQGTLKSAILGTDIISEESHSDRKSEF